MKELKLKKYRQFAGGLAAQSVKHHCSGHDFIVCDFRSQILWLPLSAPPLVLGLCLDLCLSLKEILFLKKCKQLIKDT